MQQCIEVIIRHNIVNPAFVELVGKMVAKSWILNEIWNPPLPKRHEVNLEDERRQMTTSRAETVQDREKPKDEYWQQECMCLVTWPVLGIKIATFLLCLVPQAKRCQHSCMMYKWDAHRFSGTANSLLARTRLMKTPKTSTFTLFLDICWEHFLCVGAVHWCCFFPRQGFWKKNSRDICVRTFPRDPRSLFWHKMEHPSCGSLLLSSDFN